MEDVCVCVKHSLVDSCQNIMASAAISLEQNARLAGIEDRMHVYSLRQHNSFYTFI